MTRTSRKLDRQTLAFEVAAIYNRLSGREEGFCGDERHTECYRRIRQRCKTRGQGRWQWLTWHDITRIHCIFVFDETKSIHDFDIRDFASSMRAEVIFDILLRS